MKNVLYNNENKSNHLSYNPNREVPHLTVDEFKKIDIHILKTHELLQRVKYERHQGEIGYAVIQKIIDLNKSLLYLLGDDLLTY